MAMAFFMAMTLGACTATESKDNSDNTEEVSDEAKEDEHPAGEHPTEGEGEGEGEHPEGEEHPTEGEGEDEEEEKEETN